MPEHRSGIRASDADRNRVVGLLQQHYQAGRITLAELEERTQRALSSRTLDDLQALLADLPAETAAAPDPLPDPPQPEPGRSAGLARHLAGYASVALLLVGVWALSGGGYFWPAWPLLAFAVGAVRRLGGPPRPRGRYRVRDARRLPLPPAGR